MAEDGVHEVVGGIAAEGEERGIGRILALGGVKGLGFIDKSLVSCASVNRSIFSPPVSISVARYAALAASIIASSMR